MKVLIVLHNLDLGGIQKKSLDLMRYLVSKRKQGPEVVLGLMVKDGFFYKRVPSKIKVINLNGNKISLLKLVLGYKPDVIYAPTLALTALVIKLILFWLEIKVVVSQETVLSEYLTGKSFGLLRKYLAKILLPRADKIIAVNETVKADLIEIFWVPRRLVTVVRNWVSGIPACRQAGPRSARDDDKKMGADLIYIGRLAAEKNLGPMLDIVKIVRGKFPDLKLKIVGGGSEKDRLKRKIKREGLGGNVWIKKPTADISDELADSKIFILTSAREGCPLSLLEAMAAGTAAAVPDILVMKELAKQGAGVILCSGPDEYAAAATNLLKNEKLRLRLGEMSKSAAGKYYGDKNRQKLSALLFR